jgi:NAD+ kinase
MSKTNTILLVVNKTKEPAVLLAQEIMAYCRSEKIPYFYHDTHKSPPPQHKYQLAMALGGDGTALVAGRFLYGTKTPVLAVNTGKLGFLANFKAQEWQKNLALFFEGKLAETCRTVLDIIVVRGGQTIYNDIAINDAVVSCAGRLRMIGLDLMINHESLGSIQADGLIAATATGSTAYALSCGGPILPPEARSIVVVPISPFSLSMRPLSIPQNDTITFRVKTEQRTDVILTLDGQDSVMLKESDAVHITAGRHVMWLLQPENLSFYKVLRQKLGWKGLPEGINA